MSAAFWCASPKREPERWSNTAPNAEAWDGVIPSHASRTPVEDQRLRPKRCYQGYLVLQVRLVQCTSPSSLTTCPPSPNLAFAPASSLTRFRSTESRREYLMLQGRMVRRPCRRTFPSSSTLSRPNPNLAFAPAFSPSFRSTKSRMEYLVCPSFPVSPNSSPVLTLLTKKPEERIHLASRVLEIRRILCG